MPENQLIEYLRYQVHQYPISDSGNVYVEKSPDSLFLFYEDVEIDLKSSYTISETTVIQGENIIPLETQDDLKYFTDLLEELTHAN